MRWGDSDQFRMQHIAGTANGWDHNPYWRYLRSMESEFPRHIFEFAANSENHDLTSANSLHDAWLENWYLTETRTDNGNRSSIQIMARFLGPRHDRHIELTYSGVGLYEIRNPSDFASLPYRAGHGDLLIHELRLAEHGLFAHELLFSRGSIFLVEFSDFTHRIDLINGESRL